MRTYFELVTDPESLVIQSDVLDWHVKHGWCWHVWDCGNPSRIVGIYYVTLLCGSGGVLHFESCVESIPFVFILRTMQKGIALTMPHLDLMLATIPDNQKKLIRCVERLGFVRMSEGDFLSDGLRYCMLKYLK